MIAKCELPDETGLLCTRRAKRVILVGLDSYPIAACDECAVAVENELIEQPIDFRTHKLRFFNPAMRAARIRFKSKAWDEANIEKRRESSRRSKYRQRLLNGRDPDPNQPKFLSLDLPRNNGRCDLHNVIPSAEMNPLELLIARETYENYQTDNARGCVGVA